MTGKKDIFAPFFAESRYKMADITSKKPSFRRALAMGRIDVGETGFAHIKNQTLPKGDVLKLCEVAGIQGAKLAWQHIPMCHPLLLDHVAVAPVLEAGSHSVAVYAEVETTAKTGVEMEALAAVNAALLTLYDLTKPVEPSLEISDVRLLYKEGGKKGVWTHPDGMPEELEKLLMLQKNSRLDNTPTAILTLSDRASKGIYEDKSGALLKKALEDMGAKVIEARVLPDDPTRLEEVIMDLCERVDLILTTGGTGVSPRDITPQTLLKLSSYEVPGIGEILRQFAADRVPTTWLSRSLAVVIGTTLVIALPGSTGGVKDGITVLEPILSHALAHLADKKNMHPHNEEVKNV